MVNVKEITTAKEFKDLVEESAFTFEGFDMSDESLNGMLNFFIDCGAKKDNNLTIEHWTGAQMNEWNGGLTGKNAYSEDLNFVAIRLSGFDCNEGKLAMFKLNVGARWLKDIYDNNLRKAANQ